MFMRTQPFATPLSGISRFAFLLLIGLFAMSAAAFSQSTASLWTPSGDTPSGVRSTEEDPAPTPKRARVAMLGSIADVRLQEDAGTIAIPLEFLPGFDPARVTIAVHSSNQSVLAEDGLGVGDQAGQRVLFITPLPDAHGNALVTVTLDGADGMDERRFSVNVTPINDPPALTNVAGTINVYEDETAGPIALGVRDPDSPLAGLILFAESSDERIIAAKDVHFEEIDGDLTLRLRPAAHATGAATLTVTISDGLATSSASYDVHIDAVDDATVLELSDTTPLLWNEGDQPTAIMPTLRVLEYDGDAIRSATVRFVDGYLASEDELEVSPNPRIAHRFVDGTLYLEGAASAQEYERMLREIRYTNRNAQHPASLAKALEVEMLDARGAIATVRADFETLEINDNPVARAGKDLSVTAQSKQGTPVTLDGSASFDVDDSSLQFEWRIGESLLSTDAKASTVLEPGTYTATLTVRDARGGVGRDTVSIVVR